MKPKIKIMKTGPQVTEQEINAFMDFDALLKEKEAQLQTRRRTNRLAKRTGVACLAVLVGIIALTLKNGRHIILAPGGNESIVLVPTETRVDSLQATIPPRESPKNDTETQQTPVKEKSSPPDKTEVVAHSVPKAETQPPGPVYVQAEPVAGYPALYAYFERELRYPLAHAKDSVEGVVTVAFVIDLTGKATTITIESSLGDAFDLEVRRLIQNMPLWQPATYNGNAVKSKVSLPITFSVKKRNPERQ